MVYNIFVSINAMWLLIQKGSGAAMLLYIIRHGETYGNLNGDGFTETDLTPVGEAQARLLGERFKNERIDKIYTSPLMRAIKTATAVHKFHPDTPVIIDGILFEKGTAPDYRGLPRNELKALCPSASINPISPLGNEADEDAYKRAKTVIKKIKEENPFDSTVMLVAHGTFNSYLVLAALGFPLKENFNFSHLNTGVTLVQYLYENDTLKTKLKYLNDTKHLT